GPEVRPQLSHERQVPRPAVVFVEHDQPEQRRLKLSRPNTVMNHGTPPPGIAHLIVTSSGRTRSATRSRRLWRYVRSSAASSVLRSGESSSHSSRDIGILSACW